MKLFRTLLNFSAALATVSAMAGGYTGQACSIGEPSFIVATDVSDNQMFLGHYVNEMSDTFLWDRVRGVQIVPSVPNVFGPMRALSISPNDLVVGSIQVSGKYKTFVYQVPPTGIVTGDSRLVESGQFLETQPMEVNTAGGVVGRATRSEAGPWLPYYAGPDGFGNWNHFPVINSATGALAPGTAFALNNLGEMGGTMLSPDGTRSLPFTANVDAKGSFEGAPAISASFLNTGLFQNGVVRSINGSGWKVGFVWNGAVPSGGIGFFDFPIGTRAALWSPTGALTVMSNIPGYLARVNDDGVAVGTVYTEGGPPEGTARGIDFFIGPMTFRRLDQQQPFLGYTAPRKLVAAYGINSRSGWTCVAAAGESANGPDAVILRQIDTELNAGTQAIGSVSISAPPVAGRTINSFNYGIQYPDPTLGAGSFPATVAAQPLELEWTAQFTTDGANVPGDGNGFATLFTGNSGMIVELPSGWNIPLNRAGDTIEVNGSMPGYSVEPAFFPITSPQPTFSSMTPTVGYVGQPDATVTLTGTNFWRSPSGTTGSRLLLNGAPAGLLTVLSETSATAKMPTAAATAPVVYQVGVANDASGGSAIGTQTFSIQQSATAMDLIGGPISGPRGRRINLQVLLRANNPGDSTRPVPGLPVQISYMGRPLATVQSTDAAVNVTTSFSIAQVPTPGDDLLTLTYAGSAGNAGSSLNVPITIQSTPAAASMAGGAFNFGPVAASALRVNPFGDFPTDAFTVEFWQKFSEAKAWTPFRLSGASNNLIEVAHRMFEGQGSLRYSPNALDHVEQDFGAALRNQWTKVVVSYSPLNGGRATLCVLDQDANVLIEEVLAPVSRASIPVGDLVIGLCSAISPSALVDELRIWNVALDRGAILARHRREPSLPADPQNTDAWRLDTVSSRLDGMFADSERIGGANGALLVNDPQWEPSTAPLNRIDASASTPVSVTLRAWNPDASALTFRASGTPVGGDVVVTGDQATFTPADGFVGMGSFAYEVNSGQGWSAPATVEVLVLARPVTIGGRVTVNGQVPGNPFRMSIEVAQAGSAVASGEVDVDADGAYSYTFTGGGTVTYRFRSTNSLRRTQGGMAANGATVDVNLLAGDADFDNEVSIRDYMLLSMAFASEPGLPGWDPKVDFDQDGLISILDYLLLSENFGRRGDL